MRRLTAPAVLAFALAAASLVAMVPSSSHAQQWGEIANISTTMGVADGRICTGEASRGDIGCMANAPYVSRTTGYLGVGTATPSTMLHVAGILRIASGIDTCDTDRIGAIKYQSGAFYICQNISNGWEALATTGVNSNNDRIISGTTQVITYQNTSITLATNNIERVVVGTSGNVGIAQQPVTGYGLTISGSTYIRGRLDIASRDAANNFTNILVGSNAGAANTGVEVTAIGRNAANENEGEQISALGPDAAAHNKGDNLVAIGYSAANFNQGNNVTALGSTAAYANQGGHVTAIGANAAENNTGDFAIALGSLSVQNNQREGTTGLGAYSLAANTTGLANTAAGYQALRYTQTGSYNTAVGYGAGLGVAANSFSANTLLGSYVGAALTTGSSNTIIGANSGITLTTGSHNILIGAGITPLSTTGSGQLSIGNAIFGNIGSGTSNTNLIGINIASPTTALHVSGTLTLANGAEDCDPNHLGAIRYENNNFYVCRNGTTWETLIAGANGTVDTDRLISDTLEVIANSATNSISLTTGGITWGYLGIGATYLPDFATDTIRVNNGNITLDNTFGLVAVGGATFQTDATGETFGIRPGASDSNIFQWFNHAGNVAGIINAAGQFGIGTQTPSATLHVSGSLRIATTTDGCDTDRLGAMKFQDGQFYICRDGLNWETVAAGNINTDRITSSTTAAVIANKDGGTVSFTLGGVNNAAYLDPQIGFVGPGVSTTGTISSSDINTGYVVLRGTSGTAGVSITLPGDDLGSHIATSNLNMANFSIINAGKIGVSLTTPSATLHVAGAIRMAADPAQTCDTFRLGTIKYEGGFFYICKNTSNGWESLATTGANTLADRIVSGTAYVQSNVAGNVTISGTTYIGYNTATSNSLEIGFGGTGNRSALIDLTGDATYTDYGLRIIRLGTGANAMSHIVHRGTGNLEIATTEAAPIVFDTAGTEAMRIMPTGFVGISTSIPSATLHVAGAIRMAADGAQTCDTHRLGTVKYEANQFYVCKNISNGWENLATTGPNTLTDRIVSGTAYVQSNVAGNVTISGTTYIGFNTATSNSLELGFGGTGNRSALIDLTGDATYTDYALRLIRHNGGANALSQLIHRGTGNLEIATTEAAPIVFTTAGTESVRIVSAGYVGIGTIAPSTTLHVVSNTSYQVRMGTGTAAASHGYLGTDATGFTRLGGQVGTALMYGSPAATPQEALRVTNLGLVGISTTQPSTSLHVSGTLRISDGNEACDTFRLGALKYEANQFYVCRNTSNGWEAMATSGGASSIDRIVSGTTYVQSNLAGNVTVSGTAYFGFNTPTSATVKIGFSPTASRNAVLDLVGDTSYTDYGLRIIRTNTGANAPTNIIHRGTGAFTLQTTEAAPLVFNTSNGESMRIMPTGFVGISTSIPSATLHVAGAIRMAADGAQTCDTHRLGTVKYETNQFYVCKNTANGWEAMATTGANTLADRIVSGTSYVQANGPGGNVTISGTTYIGYQTATSSSLEIGFGSTANSNAVIDLTGDTSYTDYGLRLIRNGGANSMSQLLHRGTGALTLQTTEAAPIVFNTTGAEAVRIVSTGNVGIGAIAPSATLHVAGAIRMATDGAQTCDTNRLGTVKYETNQFYVCKNTSNGWEAMATTGANTLADRIVSGTAYVQSNIAGNVTISGTTYIGYQTATSATLEIGFGSTANSNAVIDLTGDATYTDFGLRIIRTNTGANAPTNIIHRGTGALTLRTQEAAPIVFDTSNGESMRIMPTGFVGISTSIPSATLHVAGAIRMAADGAQTCDTHRLGTVKYEAGQFYVCRNISNGWETMATSGGTSSIDRIVSGTAYVQANGPGRSVTISGTTHIGYNTNTDAILKIGTGPTGNRYAYLDLIGDTTYDDYGLRLIRANTGVNASSTIFHRGTGSFIIQTTEAAPIAFNTNSAEAMRIISSGLVGIGVITPTTKLEVAGRVSTTTVQLSNSPADACNAAAYGTMKMVNGRPYVCRP